MTFNLMAVEVMIKVVLHDKEEQFALFTDVAVLVIKKNPLYRNRIRTLLYLSKIQS